MSACIDCVHGINGLLPGSPCRDCHKNAQFPEPDEAAESARTSGSPTATRSDSVGTTALQLAPVLRPAVGAGHKVAGMDFIDWLYLSMLKKQIEDMIKNATA